MLTDSTPSLWQIFTLFWLLTRVERMFFNLFIYFFNSNCSFKKFQWVAVFRWPCFSLHFIQGGGTSLGCLSSITGLHHHETPSPTPHTRQQRATTNTHTHTQTHTHRTQLQDPNGAVLKPGLRTLERKPRFVYVSNITMVTSTYAWEAFKRHSDVLQTPLMRLLWPWANQNTVNLNLRKLH